jgi:peptidyl-Asp metalloendopeptidase
MFSNRVYLTAIAAVFCPLLSCAVHAAAAASPPVYQATEGRPLTETLHQVEQNSGIHFRINIDLSQDQLKHNISAADWNNAVSQLLSGYNYSTESNGKQIKTVVISGKNTATTVQPIPSSDALPGKYSHLAPGAVTVIQLPIDQLMQLKPGSQTQLELPIGRFNIAHDQTIIEADGSKTWIGFIADAGAGYQILLSQTRSGTLGVITTPEGSYNIDTENNVTYLVDVGQSLNLAAQ